MEEMYSIIKNRPKSPLVTCQDGADFLGISKGSFWDKCRRGEIPHIRLSRRCYRVRLSDLENFLNARAA
jgi:excisionase family DNA binding protein